MEMKKMVVFMVMMLTIGNLIVESKVINRRWGDCFKLCYNVCITGPIRDKLGCFPKCTKECTHLFEIDCVDLRCVSAQDMKKEIDVKKAKKTM
ncbi:hypothetical protein N665_0199s0045 [Sinapis alba]|nr:hypothetical protein N665_0199s0045 [Sinapis alba]